MTPLSNLQHKLRTVTYNKLRLRNIETIEQLESMTDDELLKVNGVGKGAVTQIRKAIAVYRSLELMGGKVIA